jgi:DNA-binding CsgD family transcriptional regulator
LRSVAAVFGTGPSFACEISMRKNVFQIDSRSTVSWNAPADLLAIVLEGLHKAPPKWVSNFRHGGPARCVLTSEADPSGALKYRGDLEHQGVADGVNILAVDLDSTGFLISCVVPPGYVLPAATRLAMRSVARHILAAMRLRRRLGVTQTPGEAVRPVAPSRDPEAVFDTNGRVLHAEGAAKLEAARVALRSAVRDVERVRARPKHMSLQGAREGLQEWKALVAARWSLIDQFEEGGKRYIVAQENRPNPPGMGELTPTECSVVAHLAAGCSTKEIAYAMGLNDATIRVLLSRAAKRCHAESRRELLAAWATARGE